MAVQTLLAREIGSGSKSGEEEEVRAEDRRQEFLRAKRIRHLIDGSILVGGLVAGSLSMLTYFQRESVLRGLTTDAGIREASRVIFPAVLITQGKFNSGVGVSTEIIPNGNGNGMIIFQSGRCH